MSDESKQFDGAEVASARGYSFGKWISVTAMLFPDMPDGSDLPVAVVSPSERWDYFVAFDARIGGPNCFNRDECIGVLLNDDQTISFHVLEREWLPWTDAIAELKALMASWRAKGWGDAADEVERPMCGDDDCHCAHGRSIYDEMGVSVEKFVPLCFYIPACSFYKVQRSMPYGTYSCKVERVNSAQTVDDGPHVGQKVTDGDGVTRVVSSVERNGPGVIVKSMEATLRTNTPEVTMRVEHIPPSHLIFDPEKFDTSGFHEPAPPAETWACDNHLEPVVNSANSPKCEAGCGRLKPTAPPPG